MMGRLELFGCEGFPNGCVGMRKVFCGGEKQRLWYHKTDSGDRGPIGGKQRSTTMHVLASSVEFSCLLGVSLHLSSSLCSCVYQARHWVSDRKKAWTEPTVAIGPLFCGLPWVDHKAGQGTNASAPRDAPQKMFRRSLLQPYPCLVLVGA